MAAVVYTQSELRELVLPLLERFDMASAFLFGSYARNEATASSDIDLLLEGNAGFKALGVFGVAEELHRLTGKAVDVYEISELDRGPFKDAVLREAVRL